MSTFFVVFRNGVPPNINGLKFLGFTERGLAVYSIEASDIYDAFKHCHSVGDVSKTKPPLKMVCGVSPNY